ncbi:MAG TPA: HAMP domain-containing protein [Desulfobulbus sp.]|nr:HAMP domain-containing protein [Desulfobulbus sp.]
MKSISFRFALASVSVALLVFALVGGVNYLFLKKALLEDAGQRAGLIVEKSSLQIQEIITRTRNSSQQAMTALRNGGYSPEVIKKVLTRTLRQEPLYYGMAMAFEPGVFRDTPFCPYYFKKDGSIHYLDLANNTYWYEQKAWYGRVKKELAASWSDLYFDKGGGETLMATYSAPVMEQNRFAGVLTIDLSLESLQQIISSIHVLRTGYAILLSRNNKILVHPDGSKIMQQYSQAAIEYDRIIREGDHWIYYGHVGSTRLTLGIVMPQAELFATLHTMSMILVVLALLGALLLIVTMVMVSRRLTRPIEQLTALTREISLGNFEKKIELPKTHDEIYQLTRSVHRMQDAIRQYMEDIQSAARKQQKIESELEIAGAIQMSMLPGPLPETTTVEVAATLQPARAVGGDFYDYFHMDDEHLCLVMADVSGKGMPAAMFMATAISYIRAYGDSWTSAAKIVGKLNRTMVKNNEANMFVTLFLAVLNLRTGRMSFVNGGHTEPYLIDADGITKLPSSGNPPIGAFEGVEYREETIVLSHGQQLFLYTDGVNEAYAADDEQFGEKRLGGLLKQCGQTAPAGCLASIREALDDFCRDCEQSDDITMLCVRYP